MLKVAISNIKNYLLVIIFLNSNLVISIREILLGKLLSLTKTIKRFTNQKQQVSIFNSQVIKILIINV